MTEIKHHKTQRPEFENQLNAICKDKPYSRICTGAITYLYCKFKDLIDPY